MNHRFVFFSTLALLVPSIASAHPGHGSVPHDSLLHVLLEPVHAAALLAVVGFVVLLHIARRRMKSGG